MERLNQMKRYVRATTIDNNLLDSTKQVAEEIAKRYDLLYTTPKDDYVLKGDSFAFKVNNHNVYRVVYLYLKTVEKLKLYFNV